jgi:hypothetical protein
MAPPLQTLTNAAKESFFITSEPSVTTGRDYTTNKEKTPKGGPFRDLSLLTFQDGRTVDLYRRVSIERTHCRKIKNIFGSSKIYI